jgi:hypothetical protein
MQPPEVRITRAFGYRLSNEDDGGTYVLEFEIERSLAKTFEVGR